ncbi:MAG: M48 family metallopeptidase [Planctomycetes bacterium]|nr:M48 family metallopeptidase [Planctomycetota bacterium]
MATDFFERQSDARRSTKWLVGMFVLSVVVIVGTITVVTALGIGVWNQNRELQVAAGLSDAPVLDIWQVPLFAGVGSLALILLGSSYKVAQLRGGGTSVAENVGGRRIPPNTTDPVERRLVNVVEEMALASGVPVPPVYMLPKEQGINAFAAGYSPSDAVVAVTRGTAEQLSRDELQGVIAHEFSHILNGDMRLNIRLIGVLHGILLLGLIGRFLLHSSYYGSHRRSSKDNSGSVMLLIGIVLIAVGLIGSLCGNLIKAALSRQREYLADASAVQFTRNPGGIAGALKRIGAAITGSRLQHRNASEMSHMYFSQGVWEGFSGLMATHPPLSKRILALDPNWNGKYPAASKTPVALTEIAGASGFAGATRFPGESASTDDVFLEVVENATDQIGNPTEIHRRYARELVRTLPLSIVEAVHDPYGARAVIFALLLDKDDAVRSVQMQALTDITTPDIVKLTQQLAPAVRQLDARVRLPLVDMSLPALRAMAKSQYLEFSTAFQELVAADQRLGLFEWTLHRILLRHLSPQFNEAAAPRIAYYGLQRLAQPCSVLLSTLAYAGNEIDEARTAFAEAARHLPRVKIELLPTGQCGLQQLDQALNELAKVAAKHRERLIDACAAAICADDEVKIREAELLRGISDMLDCPMPPLLPGQQVKMQIE